MPAAAPTAPPTDRSARPPDPGRRGGHRPAATGAPGRAPCRSFGHGDRDRPVGRQGPMSVTPDGRLPACRAAPAGSNGHFADTPAAGHRGRAREKKHEQQQQRAASREQRHTARPRARWPTISAMVGCAKNGASPTRRSASIRVVSGAHNRTRAPGFDGLEESKPSRRRCGRAK